MNEPQTAQQINAPQIGQTDEQLIAARQCPECERLRAECAGKDSMLNALSKSVTDLCLAIDPTSMHGPGTERIASFLKHQRMEMEGKVAYLWVALEKSRCSCYLYQCGESGVPQEAKCARCKALEHFEDAGKGWHSPEEWDQLQAACAEMRWLINNLQSDLTNYLVPDSGITERQTLSTILGRLDGPQSRHALSSDCGKGWRSPEQFANDIEPTIYKLRRLQDVVCPEDGESIQVEIDRLEKLKEDK